MYPPQVTQFLEGPTLKVLCQYSWGGVVGFQLCWHTQVLSHCFIIYIYIIYIYNIYVYVYIYIYIQGFTPWKTEQPLQGIELQEKEAQKD